MARNATESLEPHGWDKMGRESETLSCGQHWEQETEREGPRTECAAERARAATSTPETLR